MANLDLSLFQNQTELNDNNYIPPTTKSLVQTLTQVINSNDYKLLDEIVNSTGPNIINFTVELLPSNLAYKMFSLVFFKFICIFFSLLIELKLIIQSNIDFFLFL